ncbi:hypothetical protein ACMXYV_01940 [Neptuniibacter sp. SY11_33]|uniref:hypothetical protein n=1 Tax=Neptuniibacter sp. SY11_33 TaxID=3398215 RepID=UPI0039F54529
MKLKTLLLAAVLFLTGCMSSPAIVKQDPNLSTENSTKLVIYRPADDIFGIATELRAFINDQYVGKLNSGGASIERLVSSGTNLVEVKSYFLGIQDGPIAKIQVDTQTGQSLFLRLTRDPGMPVVNGNATYSIGAESKLIEASQESWVSRR